MKSLQLNGVGPSEDTERDASRELLESSHGWETWQWMTTTPGIQICSALERNVALPEQWRLLVWLSRKSTSPSLRSVVAAMTEQGFQRAVFAYLLPAAACEDLDDSV